MEAKRKAQQKTVGINNTLERAARQHEKDPVWQAVMLMLNVRGAFRGKVSELLIQLEVFHTDIVSVSAPRPEFKRSGRWPKDATRLSGVLRRLTPRLRADGIDVQFNVRISENVKKGIEIKKAALREGNKMPQVPVKPHSMELSELADCGPLRRGRFPSERS